MFPTGVGLPPGFLLCVRVRRPRTFGFLGNGLLLFFFSFLGVWVLFLVCVCVCSLLSVVLYTQFGFVLLSPCAWVYRISCGYSLEYVLCAVHCPLDFALCEFVSV